MVTGVANLAVSVSDLERACDYYRRAGAALSGPHEWRDARRADVDLGPLRLTMSTRALYEDRLEFMEDLGPTTPVAGA
jgi:hypothetical protein